MNVTLVESEPREPDYEADEETIKAVAEKFEQLGDSCKELLTRFYFKKQSLGAIAKNFDWTEATARNNKYRCIQRLKALLDK